MTKEELQKIYQTIVLKTNGGIDDYVVALCQIGNAISELDNQQQQIVGLQHKLEVAEKALNKMSEYAIENNDLYDLVSDFNISNERYDEDHCGIDTCDVVNYFKEQAEKEIKGESHE